MGSNLFNILSILGITALIKPVPIGGQIAAFDIPFTLGIAVISLILIYLFRNIGRMIGVVFMVTYAGYIIWLYAGGTL